MNEVEGGWSVPPAEFGPRDDDMMNWVVGGLKRAIKSS
jgi:hypothetical protein